MCLESDERGLWPGETYRFCVWTCSLRHLGHLPRGLRGVEDRCCALVLRNGPKGTAAGLQQVDTPGNESTEVRDRRVLLLILVDTPIDTTLGGMVHKAEREVHPVLRLGHIVASGTASELDGATLIRDVLKVPGCEPVAPHDRVGVARENSALQLPIVKVEQGLPGILLDNCVVFDQIRKCHL